MSDWGEETTQATPSWLTRDECIERYQFDPTGYPEEKIKSKLSARAGHLARVWLESAIIAACKGVFL